MSNSLAEGVLDYPNFDRSTDYLFRVSLKALVMNERGEVLVVKESGRNWWDMPGGGMDHGEDVRSALARELLEEVAYRGDFESEIIAAEDPKLIETIRVWQMRLVYLIKPQSDEFAPGADADEILWADPIRFRDSSVAAERAIYAYALLA